MSAPYAEADAVLKTLREAEDKHNLFDMTVSGWSAWQTLRFRVFLELSALTLPSPAGEGRLARARRYARAFRRALGTLLARPRADFLVKTFASARRDVRDGRSRDIYFDDVLDGPVSVFRLETANLAAGQAPAEPPARPAQMDAAAVDALGGLLARLWVPAEVDRTAARLADVIQSEWRIRRMTRGTIRRALAGFYWRKKLYGALLAVLRPRAVLVADTGEWALLAAAKERGVRFVEFQHGLLHALHPTILPSDVRADPRRLLLPDRYFLYGDYWVDRLRTSRWYDGRLESIGSVHLDALRRRREARLARPGDGATRLLLTSQGLDVPALIRFIRDVLAAGGAAGRVEWIVKTHPGYEADGGPYREAFKDEPRVRVVPGMASPSTYELLAEADFHLSVSSSCHYDALGLGVPTVVLGLPTHDYVKHLCDEGLAFFATTAADLVPLVANAENRRVPRGVSEMFFRPGALKNARMALGIPAGAEPDPAAPGKGA